MFHTLGEVKNRANRAEHEPPFRIEGERTVVRHADRLICATPHERDFLVQLYGAHRDCVSIVPAGVDLGRFCPGDRAQAKRDLNLGEELLVLFVGRIEPLKGVDILIQALAVTELDQPLTAIVAGGDAASADIAGAARAGRSRGRRRQGPLRRHLAPRGAPHLLPRRGRLCHAPPTTRASASLPWKRWPAARR